MRAQCGKYHMGQYKVPTKGPHAKFLRDKLGLSINALASKAGVYPRVVSSIEDGDGAKPYELGLVADALGTTYEDLVAESPAKSSRPKVHKPVEAIATLRLNGLSKKAVASLILDIEEAFKAKCRIEVTDISFSSIIVTLRIDRGDLWRLIDAFGDGRLDDFEFESLALSTYYFLMFMGPSLAVGSVVLWWFPLAGAAALLAALAAFRSKIPGTLKVEVTLTRVVISKRRPSDPADGVPQDQPQPKAIWKDSQPLSPRGAGIER